MCRACFLSLCGVRGVQNLLAVCAIVLRQVDIIDDLVMDAVRGGAKVLCGGKRNAALAPGLFYEPTVLSEVTHKMRIVNEEVFGPVMTIIRVHSDEECIRLVNSTPYGLGSRCGAASVLLRSSSCFVSYSRLHRLTVGFSTSCFVSHEAVCSLATWTVRTDWARPSIRG